MYGGAGVANHLGEKKHNQQYRPYSHTPAIECPSSVQRGQPFKISVSLEKILETRDDEDLPVRWLTLYFYPDGNASPYKLETIPVDSGKIRVSIDERTGKPCLSVKANCRIDGAGTLFAIAFCNVQEFFYSYKRLLVE